MGAGGRGSRVPLRRRQTDCFNRRVTMIYRGLKSGGQGSKGLAILSAYKRDAGRAKRRFLLRHADERELHLAQYD